ncbi:hypothetical protein Lepto7375DRAFT_4941 [Leptolyngbya sp. PCC 7375]|nr:hypothetical protein Lepto7375DRAFT_4941 [Leptolyngbya sp. PCC 7375]
MNDLDMELQTIRQKLQILKASPPETMAAPWSPSRLTAPSPNLAQVTTAIETLRQRSGQTLSSSPVPGSSLQQFDAALGAVEQLAQQQRQALRRLQSVGDSLIQHIQPGTSPDIDDIARFLAECQAIQIPTVQRDADGYLDLIYYTVDFHQAEHDATSNAQTLRLRSQPLFKHSLHQEQGRSNGFDDQYYRKTNGTGFVSDLKRVYQQVSGSIQRWTRRYSHSRQQTRVSQFTLLDSAIWCIGAAIFRLILNQLFQIHPALWPPVAFILIAGIILSLYRAILSPRPDPVLGYRTLMIILGLLVGGRFA